MFRITEYMCHFIADESIFIAKLMSKQVNIQISAKKSVKNNAKT